jgi:hypothetical protein
VPDSGLEPYHNLFNSSFSGPTWLTGGTVGPEASIFTPIVLLVVAICFALVYRDNLYRIHVHAPEFRPQPSNLGSQTL